MNLLKKKIKIKINKKFQEKMYYKMNSDGERSSSSKNESEVENFNWVDENNEFLKRNYIRFPFKLWKEIIEKHNDFNNKIIDEGRTYQKVVCDILQYDIFKDEQFEREIVEFNKFLEFLKNSNLETSDIYNANPDFFVKEIKVTNFLEIIKRRNYMITYDTKTNNLQNIEFIYLIGEIKINSKRIKDKKNQKSSYLNLCKSLNSNNKNIFFFTFYIFDEDYKKFWGKKFFEGKPIIIGYIPKLFKYEYLNAFYKINPQGIKMINNIEENINESKNNEKKNEIIKQDNTKLIDKTIGQNIKDMNLKKINEIKDDLNNGNNDNLMFQTFKGEFGKEFVKKEFGIIEKKTIEIDEEIKRKWEIEDKEITMKREYEDKIFEIIMENKIKNEDKEKNYKRKIEDINKNHKRELQLKEIMHKKENEDLKKENEEFKKKIEALKKENENLKKEIEELKKLNKESNNFIGKKREKNEI